MSERCPLCGFTPATPRDEYDERRDLCWRDRGDNTCGHPIIDWRARALAAEARLETRSRFDDLAGQLVDVANGIDREVESRTIERIAAWLDSDDEDVRGIMLARMLRAGAWKSR